MPHFDPDTEDNSSPKPESNWPNADQIRFFTMLFATGFGLYLCYLLTIPFLTALTWALVLSVMFSNVHRKIELRFGKSNFSAFFAVSAVAILVVVPVVFVAQVLVRETANGTIYLEGALRNGEWRQTISGYPTMARAVIWIEHQLDLAGTAGSIASYLTTLSTSVLRNSISQLINVVLIFYLLFFFFRDKRQILQTLQSFSTLSVPETTYILNRFADAIHATVYGTLVMAAVQGVLGGLMFWWLGLPLPLLWAVVMAMLAIVPILGASIIWVPAAIYLALEGDWGKALIMAGWGGGVIASIDNLLFPMLVGNRLKLHTIPALIGAFGGIIMFGASGLVLGPAIIAVTLALIKTLKKRFDEDAHIELS